MGIDFFRDPPGRFLGYCHAVGRALPDELVPPIAKTWLTRTTIGYVAFDVLYKAIDNRRPNPILKGADALIWQALASIVIPSLTVETIGRGSNMLMHNMKVAKPMSAYIPLGLVLISMPLLGNFIDESVHYVMDHTTRPLMMR